MLPSPPVGSQTLAVHRRLVEVEVGSLLDVGDEAARNMEVVVEADVEVGHLPVGLVDPERALQLL